MPRPTTIINIKQHIDTYTRMVNLPDEVLTEKCFETYTKRLSNPEKAITDFDLQDFKNWLHKKIKYYKKRLRRIEKQEKENKKCLHLKCTSRSILFNLLDCVYICQDHYEALTCAQLKAAMNAYLYFGNKEMLIERINKFL